MRRRHHKYWRDDEDAHGLSDVARQNAQTDYAERFGGGRLMRSLRALDNDDYREEPANRFGEQFGERYGDSTSRAQTHGHRGRGPKDYQRSDERIYEDLCERLWEADDVDASDVSVAVRDGVVTLSGSVTQRRIKHRIEDTADDCAGVRDIHNEIHVQRRNERPNAERAASDSAGE